MRKKGKIVIAMSGGVDSSVAAALLKKQGFNVVGVFMKFWKAPGFGQNRCCSQESEKRARKVAKILRIPFYVFNFEKEFKKKVVDYFLSDHKVGLTPNPCVVCNKEIKFGLLLEKSLSLGADYIATGHYAQIKKIENRKQKIKYKLLESKDKLKDQSYFLWKLGQDQLNRVLFPVGKYTRSEVEKMSKKFKLPFTNVKKSTEVCFIPKSTEDFLEKYLKKDSGEIIDRKKNMLGKHEGLHFYTIGQRRGIKLPGGPYYVLDKNIKNNRIIVTKNEKDLLKNEISVKSLNWLSGKEPKLPLKIQVKIRYRAKTVPAIIKKIQSSIYNLKFARSQRAVTPGQSAVFYKGKELLGGGIII